MHDHAFYGLRFLLAGIIAICVLAACGGSDSSRPSDPTPSTEANVQTFDLVSANTGLTENDRLLVWMAPGTEPGRQSVERPGRIALVDQRGRVEFVLDLTGGTTRVHACGEAATSPNGRYFAFYAGTENGTLYLVDGVRPPQRVADIRAAACVGNGSFRFTPNGERLGYIDFAPEAVNAPIATGMLYIHNSGSRQQNARFENVAAFDMQNDRTAFVSVYTNSQGEATEAALFIWRNNGDPDEVTTLFPSTGCQFTSAGVSWAQNGLLAVLMGQRCGNGRGTGWTAYTVNPGERSATQRLSGSAVGGFFSESRTNLIAASPQGDALFFTVPDGLGRNTVGVRSVQLTADPAPQNRVSNGLMPRITARIYEPPATALPARSPDGRWLAITSNSANNDAAIHILDLHAPDLPPITLPAGSRGDTILALSFSQDSRRLLFVAGGSGINNNSLFSVDLNTGVDTRVIRGRYTQMVLSPDGSVAALSEWQIPSVARQPAYLNLMIVNLATNQSAALVQGARVTEGIVSDQHFVYPLAWRRG